MTQIGVLIQEGLTTFFQYQFIYIHNKCIKNKKIKGLTFYPVGYIIGYVIDNHERISENLK